MPKIDFIVKESGYGCLGLAPIRMPNFEPLFALGVCHDVLEHYFLKDNNSIGFELSAIGMSLITRPIWKQHEEPYCMGKEEEVFSSSLCEIFDYFASINRSPLYFPMKRIPSTAVPSDIDRMYKKILSEMLRYVRTAQNDSEDYRFRYSFLLNQIEETGIYWLRYGYKIANSRYKGNFYPLQRAFYSLYNDIKNLLTDDELGEYSKVTVVFTYKNPAQYKIKIDYEY